MNKKLANREIIQQVDAIYKWLDEQCVAHGAKAGDCSVCGKCCDFEAFGHRLYVTTPEMLYLTDRNKKGVRPLFALGGRCSYQIDNKCSVYKYRFAGCRIFCCKGDAGLQSELTEAVIKKFKTLCDEFQIPYRYVDLPTALRISPPHT